MTLPLLLRRHLCAEVRKLKGQRVATPTGLYAAMRRGEA